MTNTIRKLIGRILPLVSAPAAQARLRELVANECVVLFGAGASIHSGLPGGYDLATALAQSIRNGYPSGNNLLLALEDLLLLEPAMQTIADYVGAEPVASLIASLDSTAPSPAHRLLACMIGDSPVRRLYTTNFDTLVERAVLDAGGSCDAIRTAPYPVRRLTVNDHSVDLHKIHGDAKHSNSAVATISAYVQGVPSELRGQFVEDVQGRMLLVLGFAGWDLDFLNLVLQSPSCPSAVLWIDLDDEAAVAVKSSSTALRTRQAAARRLTLVKHWRSQGCEVALIGANVQQLAIDVLDLEATTVPAKPKLLANLSTSSQSRLKCAGVELVARVAPDRLRKWSGHDLLPDEPSRERDMASIALGEAWLRASRKPEARRLLASVLGGSEHVDLKVVAAFWLGKDALDDGDWGRGREHFAVAQQMCSPSLVPLIRCLCENEIRFWTGGAEELRKIKTSRNEIFRLSSSVRTYSQVRLYLEGLERLAAVFHFTGDPAEALEVDLRYLDIASSAGDIAAYGRGLAHVGVCWIALGEMSADAMSAAACFRSAEQNLRDALPILEIADDSVLPRHLANLGEVNWKRGEYEQGLSLMRTALRALNAAGQRPMEVYFWAAAGEGYLHWGRPKRAYACGVRSVMAAIDTGEWGEGSYGLLVVGRSLQSLGVSTASAKLLRIAAQLAHEKGNGYVNRLARNQRTTDEST